MTHLLRPQDLTGVVLAGGASRRLGRNKAVEPVGGEPLIRRVLGRLGHFCRELVVAAADLEQARALALPRWVRVTVDRYPGKGSLGGIFAGVAAASHPWSIAVACDMPFLNLDLLRHMLSLREKHDVVMPVVKGLPEPLHALYHQSCLPVVQEQLQKDDLKIAHFFDRVRVCYVPEETVRQYDPDLLSFFNINTQEDLEWALALVAQGR